jgi:hypothetical protein
MLPALVGAPSAGNIVDERTGTLRVRIHVSECGLLCRARATPIIAPSRPDYLKVPFPRGAEAGSTRNSLTLARRGDELG